MENEKNLMGSLSLNNMKIGVIGIIIGASLMVLFGTSLIKSPSRVAYVNSTKILLEYTAMKEANANYKKDVEKIQVEIDNMAKDSIESSKIPEVKKFFNRKKKLMDKKHEAILNGIYNQVNEFISDLSEAKGYEMIISSTTSGNVVYAADKIDITEEVISGLNTKYHKN